MALWTISAQQGTGGRHVAELLAIAADVPFHEGKSLASLDGDPIRATLEQLECRFGRLNLAGLALAGSLGMAEAIAERAFLLNLPDVARTIINRAAHTPCVIYLAAAFAVVPDHSNAVHVRTRAPYRWRVSNYQREHLVDRRRAEKTIRSDDRRQHACVRALWHLDADDDSHYTVVLDASRLPDDRLVRILLNAAAINGRVSNSDTNSA
jgi:cytidylate kinase